MECLGTKSGCNDNSGPVLVSSCLYSGTLYKNHPILLFYRTYCQTQYLQLFNVHNLNSHIKNCLCQIILKCAGYSTRQADCSYLP